MSDVATALTSGGPQTTSLKLGPAPQLRVESYCAECGTWDQHGPICETCGYDFTAAFCPGSFRPLGSLDDEDR